MSKPSPTLTSKRFFLSLHRYISTTSSSITHHYHHHPSLPAQTQATTTQHLHPPSSSSSRHLKPTPPPSHRQASTSTTTTTTSEQTPLATPTSNPPTSHYDLFPETLPTGPPPRGPFTLNPRLLRSEFLRLQSRSHPDLHRHGPDKARAEGTSALINEAYKTLLDPLSRAQHILALRGIDVGGDNESAKVEDDDELLVEVLEVREAIEGAGREEEVEGLRGANEARIRESERVLEEAFRGDEIGVAKREAVRLKYWMNVKESLDAWEKGKPVVLVH